MPHRKVNYLICATPRVGSTLLCEGLRLTGVAGMPAEFFWDEFASQLTTGCFPRANSRRWFTELRSRESTPNQCFGMKVMWGYMIHLLRFVGTEGRPGSRKPWRLLELHLPRLRAVFIRRRDKVRQAVSWVRALQTGVWSRPRERAGSIPVRSARYDPSEISAAIDTLATHERAWEQFFSTNGVEPLEILYEDMNKDLDSTVRRVLRYLDLPDFDGRRLPEVGLRRQSDRTTEDWLRCWYAGPSSLRSSARAGARVAPSDGAR
jgi:LPS sulfotransferase NodH